MRSSPVWLFDLDGTLADTAPDLIAAVNAMRSARDMEALPLAELRSEASNGARGLLGRALNLRPEDADFAAARDEFLGLYSQSLSTHTRLFPRIAEVLQTLTASGRRWGIVTNKPIALARPLVADLDLQPAVLLGGDSALRPKPDPALLWLAAAHLNVPAAQCLYLGDAPRDIEAGRAAGMRTIACGWGYVEDGPDPAQWGADLYAREVGDLLSMLR